MDSTECVAVLFLPFLDRPLRSFSSSLDEPSETPENRGLRFEIEVELIGGFANSK